MDRLFSIDAAFLAHERSGSHMHIGSVVAFLTPEQTLAVAIMSYNGSVDIGLIGDYDAMPDLEDLAAMFEYALGELREAAADLKPAGRPPG